jgi:hypothetical protein
MLDNFVILRNGDCIFNENYPAEGSEPLRAEDVLSLSSSLSILMSGHSSSSNTLSTADSSNIDSKSLSTSESLTSVRLHEDLYDELAATNRSISVVLGGKKFVASEMGSVIMLIAQGSKADSDAFLRSIIRDAQHTLLFYLGQFYKEAQDAATVESVLDFVDIALRKSVSTLEALVQGNPWVYVEEETRFQLDRTLANLEEVDYVLGSCIVMGKSVVHSRLEAFDTRMVLYHLSTRDMGSRKLRTIPVYSGGVWKHMVILRLRSMCVVVMTSIQCPMSRVLPLLEELEESLAESSLQIPAEEPHVMLRHYTGHETVAFLYVEHENKMCVAPEPRPVPDVEAGKIIQSFSSLFSTVGQLTESPSPSSSSSSSSYFKSSSSGDAPSSVSADVSVRLSGYRFSVTVTPAYSLYAMYSELVDSTQLKKLNEEIYTNVQRHHVGQ